MEPAPSMRLAQEHLAELDLGEVVDALARDAAVALPLLGERLRTALLEEARGYAYRPARAVVGSGDRLVRQRMEVHDDFPANSRFHELTAAFQALWDGALAAADSTPFEGRLVFNDLMLQRYTVGELGITAHRDRTAYRNLVCLFVLSGKGRFYVCGDRSGANAREVRHGPGDVLLMRAPGFLGSSERPFHFVRAIREPRYVFGLRQERR